MTPKLYVILGSHACRTGILMLDHKGIDYRTVMLPTGLHPLVVRLRGFPASAGRREVGPKRPVWLRLGDRLGTVPALAYDGERVQSNREIARFLDRRVPEPPLFPRVAEERAQVEEAELWGDQVFQMAARRLAAASVLHGPDALVNRANDGRLGPLLWKHEGMRFRGVKLVGKAFAASAASEAELLAALPGMLDRVDAWAGAGVLNGPGLNAADFMIAPSLALIGYRRDLRPELEARPSWALVDRVLPEP